MFHMPDILANPLPVLLIQSSILRLVIAGHLLNNTVLWKRPSHMKHVFIRHNNLVVKDCKVKQPCRKKTVDLTLYRGSQAN